MNKKSVNKDLEEFKYLIDSRNFSSSERKKEKDLILKAREKRYSSRSENEIKVAKLLQLKYKMEEYLNNPICHYESLFPKFLTIYVDTLYKKRKNFASDISITPIFLSHVLNEHREAKEIFLHRLIVHSKDTYKNVCEFDLDLWPKVYYQDKVCHFLASSDKWKKSEEKFVKSKTFIFKK